MYICYISKGESPINNCKDICSAALSIVWKSYITN